MKKKILTVPIVLMFVAVIMCANLLFITPNTVANAQADIEMYLFIEDVNQPLPKANTVVSNKQIGLYANPYKFDDGSMIIYIMSIDNKLVYEVKNNVTYFPIKDGVTYIISIFSKTLTCEVPARYISYDLQKPSITAETMENTLDNGSIVIGQMVMVHAQDNWPFVDMLVSKNGEEEELFEDMSYIITEDGTYTFYAVDLAGNYSDEFTITYYKKKPVIEVPEEPTESDKPIQPIPPTEPDEPIQPVDPTPPDEPIKPDDPIAPTNPTVPEEPIMDSENTTSQDDGKILIVVVGAIIIIGIVTIVIYRKIKAKAAMAHFDDDE